MALCIEQLEYNQRKKEEGKKTRLEKEQVQDLLFAAFEKHQYYNIKDLVRITNQPIVSITDGWFEKLRKDICTVRYAASKFHHAWCSLLNCHLWHMFWKKNIVIVDKIFLITRYASVELLFDLFMLLSCLISK